MLKNLASIHASSHIGQRIRTVMLAGLLTLMQAANAERLEAPLDLLYNPLNVLVSGKVDEVNPQGRIVFERNETLSAKVRPPDLIDVQVPPQVLKQVAVGGHYIFAYSPYARDPRQPEALIGSPVGPVLLVSAGLEPALFRDNSEVRKLLKLGKSEAGRESRNSLTLLLATLQNSDMQLQNLAAAQIAIEQELREHLRPGDLPAIRTIVIDPKAHPSARAVLLRAAIQHPQQFGRDSWLDAALGIIKNESIDLVSIKTLDSGELVLLAFDVAGKQTSEIPNADLARWVACDNPAIAEKALLKLRQQAPDQERPAIEKALTGQQLTPSSRKFLLDHLRRLDLARGK